ncbi:MAG: protein phosphatase 2C domain-containing protein [Ktedonobacteraceae bacterium]|nr:protein phosphatase 2C domain-containing protein [Ktedonobacteraceae bacterium]
MSLQRFTARKQLNSILSLLGGVLLACSLVSLSVTGAVAASSHAALDTPPQSENVARAGVSVVRLLVRYTTADRQIIGCTGLGALVNSTPSLGGINPNNWILTDGNLVNPGGTITCKQPQNVSGVLNSIQIFLSSAYNTQPISLSTSPAVANVHCANKTACFKDVALVSFNHNALLPFMNLAEGATAQATGSPLGLLTSATSLNLPPTAAAGSADESTYEKNIQQFLSPASLPDSVTPESGTPLVDDKGALLGLHLNSHTPVTPERIASLLQQTDIHPPTGEAQNTVHDNWHLGITEYYEKRDLVNAHSAFQKVVSANPQFQGAQDFVQLTTVKTTDRGQSTATAGPPNQQGGFTVPVLNLFLPLWLISIIALVVLVAILLLTSLLFGRSRKRRQALQEEYAEAERRATIEAQRISEMESQPRPWDQPTVVPAPAGVSTPLAAPQPGASQVGTGNLRAAPPPPAQALRCPRCNEPVQPGANYCPNCRLLLSPSESGLHLKVVPQQQPPPPPSPPAVPVGSIADQPTIDMSSADQPTLDMSAKSRPLVDMQTAATVMPSASNGEKTAPAVPRGGKRLSTVVVTRTNPGIRRKFKPNEDSIFAGKGIRASQPQQAGLFVVADGMGGHANGQDASRLAIQTIVDYMLPRLMQSSEAVDFQQLLVDGIQSANMAVHQQNMQQHGDMGTTITSALVIEDTAYIANVGDSRTYLYREPTGLAKVTQDHSVVASLVEAGIIKPDDIYTHPKRNQIYRSLGEKPSVEVDSFVVQLQVGDKLLLCSDGLWDMVRDPQIQDVVKRSSTNFESLGDGLIQAALDGGGEDNVSTIVVHMAEATKRLGKTGFQTLAKPDSVQVPRL